MAMARQRQEVVECNDGVVTGIPGATPETSTQRSVLEDESSSSDIVSFGLCSEPEEEVPCEKWFDSADMPTAIRDEMPQQSSGYPEGTKGEGKRRDSILLWNSLNKHVRENVELRKDIHDHRKLFGRALADPRTERMLKIFKTKHVGPKYILLQDSPFRVNWDIAQFFVLIYVAAVVPLRIGFSLDPTGSWYILELIIEFYFYVDLFLNFFTAYEDERGNAITDRKKITANYLKTWFVIDIISVLPVDLAFRIADESFICSLQEEGCDEDNTNPSTVLPKLMKLFRLVRLVKLLRLMRLGRLLDRYQDELFNILRVVACVKLIVFLLYLGHIFGCMMYFFSSGNDWLTPYERQEKAAGRSSAWLYSEFGDDPESVALIHRYVAAAYWAFTTMTTVGYGDIQATTVAERVFSIIGMIAGGFMLSGIIGNLFTIMEQTDLTNKAFNEKMLGVETWVKDLKMEKVDRIKILHWFRKQKIKPYNDRALLGELPLRLRHMIVHHLYHELINLVPFFSGQDMVFKSEFCVCLSPLHVFKVRETKPCYSPPPRPQYRVMGGFSMQGTGHGCGELFTSVEVKAHKRMFCTFPAPV
ncbi:hypothetical protein CYMTET_50153 [Cymbomonas tetramitiformis]|uniref:Ion transport domain-containing protein n=1 Tax=Cymbomonas tetramitiformis TaxID=36881 RepID=A0AAE0BQ09_9CHLO|nr:hypothetical protein CYMTET_50153 [Cymbomonas tetramitiformis]